MVSIGVSLYAYMAYQPIIKTVDYGMPVAVGPVEYTITYEGQFNGSEDLRPEHDFVQIRIDAKNLSQESVQISGLQFSLVDENGTRSSPIYGEFSEEDLLFHTIGSQNAETFVTQFDVPFDEAAEYTVWIQPRKEQNALDYGIACLLNC